MLIPTYRSLISFTDNLVNSAIHTLKIFFLTSFINVFEVLLLRLDSYKSKNHTREFHRADCFKYVFGGTVVEPSRCLGVVKMKQDGLSQPSCMKLFTRSY
jgi:hypothetical protein